MIDPLKEQITFWKILTEKFGTIPLLPALEDTRVQMAGSQLEEVIGAVCVDLAGAVDFSDALRRHKTVFSTGVVTMVKAGEASGQLDEMMRSIVDGLADGSFVVAGSERSREDHAEEAVAAPVARAFRAFGRLISAGVPVLGSLQIASEEARNPRLREAMGRVREEIVEGHSMSQALERFPRLFAQRVIDAIRWGEKHGKLEEALSRIVEGLESGDLRLLPVATKQSQHQTLQEIEELEQVPPVVRTVNEILLNAIRSDARAVHIEPTPDGRGRVKMRIAGLMRPAEPVAERMFQGVVSRIKIMAHLDISERRKPQDGKIGIKVNEDAYTVRVSVIPLAHGESMVLHIYGDDRTVVKLGEMGLEATDEATLCELCGRSRGLILVTGPTGSGKSTLLYSMLQEIDRETKSIATVEEPIEVIIEEIKQVPVNQKRGVTFPVAMRCLLRHDPDVVMVGDLRHLETAELALRAATAGHLVLAALHTPNATATITRLLDLGIEPFQINPALAGIISQRLIRRLCPKCKEEAKVSADTMPKEAANFLRSHKGARVYGPKGCGECRGGYKGRMVIQEILVPDERLSKAVGASADSASLRAAAIGAGMKTMFENGLLAAASGLTSVEEVCRIAWDCR